MRDYPVIESAPYCCIPASLEAILRYRGIKGITQFDIANEFGLTIDADRAVKLPEELKNISYSTDKKDIGIHLKDETLNDFFKRHGIPIQERYIPWDEISEENIESILTELREEEDAILMFDFGVLYGESRNVGIGHVGVFKSFDEYGNITYMNPGPKFLGYNTINSDDFAYAIRARHGGISILTPIREDEKIK